MFVLRLLTLGLAAASPALACEADGRGQCMALDGGGELQMDASLRLRSMYYDPTRFGVQGGQEDGYGLLRALASIRAQRDGWQAVAQLGVHAEQGRRGGAGGTDRGALDVQQGYVHWQGEHVGWQLGRQEAGYGSSRLLSVRDGPNIRLAFDGVRGRWRAPRWQLDLMALRRSTTGPVHSMTAATTASTCWAGMQRCRDAARATVWTCTCWAMVATMPALPVPRATSGARPLGHAGSPGSHAGMPTSNWWGNAAPCPGRRVTCPSARGRWPAIPACAGRNGPGNRAWA